MGNAQRQDPDGAAVVLWTGWESRWGSEEYANSDAEDVTHQPGFSVDAARWLIDTGRLGTRGALGTDTFGPDLGNDEPTPSRQSCTTSIESAWRT